METWCWGNAILNCESINWETLSSKEFKKIFSDWLNEKQRKAFYSHLMNVGEKGRFITLMEEKENASVNIIWMNVNRINFFLYKLVGWMIKVCIL